MPLRGFYKWKRPTLRFQPDSVKNDAAAYTGTDHIRIWAAERKPRGSAGSAEFDAF